MKLYNSNLVPSPRRVRIFLAEKGVSIPCVEVDLAKLDHRTPEFSTLNPFETIPILELDNRTRIAETIAICRYIEALWPETKPVWRNRAPAGDDRDVAAPARMAAPLPDRAGRPSQPSENGGNGKSAGSRLGGGQSTKGAQGDGDCR